jgi:hypothetical protein
MRFILPGSVMLMALAGIYGTMDTGRDLANGTMIDYGAEDRARGHSAWIHGGGMTNALQQKIAAYQEEQRKKEEERGLAQLPSASMISALITNPAIYSRTIPYIPPLSLHGEAGNNHLSDENGLLKKFMYVDTPAGPFLSPSLPFGALFASGTGEKNGLTVREESLREEAA